jgi:hypothetical protein
LIERLVSIRIDDQDLAGVRAARVVLAGQQGKLGRVL